ESVAVPTGGGQTGARALEGASDLRAAQPDRRCGGELVVKDDFGCFQPVGDQGVTAVVAGQLSAAAGGLPGQCRAQQSGRAGCGEPVGEAHITADLQPVREQGVAAIVAAVQPGATAIELPGDLRVCQQGRSP